MTSSRALGVYVPGVPWGVGQPFSSRIPPAHAMRRPNSVGDLIPADHGGFMTILRPKLSGLGCSCNGGARGMGTISTDFTAMMNGTATTETSVVRRRRPGRIHAASVFDGRQAPMTQGQTLAKAAREATARAYQRVHGGRIR